MTDTTPPIYLVLHALPYEGAGVVYATVEEDAARTFAASLAKRLPEEGIQSGHLLIRRWTGAVCEAVARIELSLHPEDWEDL